MEYLWHVVTMVALFSILATSFNLLVGFAGLLALAHAVFFAVGAYVTGWLSVHIALPFPLTTLASIVVAACLGTLVTLPALRVSGEHLVVVTLALQVIITAILLNLSDLTGGPDGLRAITPITLFDWTATKASQFAPIACVAALLSYGVAAWLTCSPFGRALEAMRENEMAAVSVGKNVVALKAIVFAISAGLAAVAGNLYAHYFTFVSPGTFTITLTIYVLAMVALGGRGNLLGSVIGAAVLVLLPEALKLLALPTDVADRSRDLLYGLLLIAILRVRPQGLLGRRKVAMAHRGAAGDSRPVVDGTGPAARLEGLGLRRSFGGVVAVSELDIEIGGKRIIGLIGPNGAGKTTAFNLLTGFLLPDAGTLRLDGADIGGLKPYLLARRGVARSFQDLRLFRGLGVLENVLVALPRQTGDSILPVFLRRRAVAAEDRCNVADAQRILDHVGLGAKANLDVDGLSYAEEKLLVVARLIATRARVLLFDEPLSGLDPATLARLVELIRGLATEGRTICIIEHNLDVIRSLCDHVLFLDEGRVIAQGRPAELMNDPALAARYFG